MDVQVCMMCSNQRYKWEYYYKVNCVITLHTFPPTCKLTVNNYYLKQNIEIVDVSSERFAAYWQETCHAFSATPRVFKQQLDQ